MKKFLMLAMVLAAAGCNSTIEQGPGSADLVRLSGEPVGCQFLYRLETEVSVYDTKDAEQYLRNRIADQVRRGNAYWIVSQRTRPNEWVVFGPERAFIYTANVYNCPEPNRAIMRSSTTADTGFRAAGNTDSGYGVYSGAVNPAARAVSYQEIQAVQTLDVAPVAVQLAPAQGAYQVIDVPQVQAAPVTYQIAPAPLIQVPTTPVADSGFYRMLKSVNHQDYPDDPEYWGS